MKASEICQTAAGLVGGDRERTHGDKLKNFGQTAALWNAYLGDILERPLTAVDVGLLMALVKIARVKSGSHNADNYVDLAGYAGCAGEIAEILDAGKTRVEIRR